MRERERILGKDRKDVRGWGCRLVAIVYFCFCLWHPTGTLTISLCFEILLSHMGILMVVCREHSAEAHSCVTREGGGWAMGMMYACTLSF